MNVARCCFTNAATVHRCWVLKLRTTSNQVRHCTTISVRGKFRTGSRHKVAAIIEKAAGDQALEQRHMSKLSSNGSAYLQVLGLGLDTQDTVPSVLLFFDKQRYLFNAGEGFQRYCVQHKLKLNKMPNILATRASLDALGGIPGVVLTTSDSNLSHPIGAGLEAVANCYANIYGPQGLGYLQQAMASHIRMKGISFHELSAEGAPGSGTQQPLPAVPAIQNDAVSITPVVLAAPADMQEAQGANALAQQPNKRQRTSSGGLQTQVRHPTAACYICRLTPVPGKFLPQKAKALGVTPGPLFGQLKNGIAVMGKDRMVQPDEVLEAAPAAPVVIIADCPSSVHLPALLTSPAWQPFHHNQSANGSSPQHVNCIMHLTPPEVMKMPEYQQWMAGFAKGTRHLALNPQAVAGSVSLPSPASLQIKLNCVEPKVFPLPATIAHASTASSQQPPLVPPDLGPSIQCSNLMKYNLRPAARVDTVESCDQPVSIPDIQQQLKAEMPEVLETAARAKDDATCCSGHVPEAITQADKEELEVVFLGTGAAMPSKYRNVTSIYINRFARGGMLLDCGEGTLGQLTRRFGLARVRQVVTGLACVWVSHIHADHHAGLPRLLAARAEWLGPDCAPLPVFGPWPLQKILNHMAALQPMPHVFFNQNGLVAQPQQQPSALMQSTVRTIKQQLGLKTLQSVLVVHCAHAYAAVLEGLNGWKVVFSGDTRPCDQMLQAAKDATLLIHEATFEDELLEDALAKRHSLTCEAVQIGAKSGAYRTILTHFSQRYPKIPKIEKSFLDSTCIAFDLMSVNLKDLPTLPAHVPAVALLCKDVDEDAEDADTV